MSALLAADVICPSAVVVCSLHGCCGLLEGPDSGPCHKKFTARVRAQRPLHESAVTSSVTTNRQGWGAPNRF